MEQTFFLLPKYRCHLFKMRRGLKDAGNLHENTARYYERVVDDKRMIRTVKSDSDSRGVWLPQCLGIYELAEDVAEGLRAWL